MTLTPLSYDTYIAMSRLVPPSTSFMGNPFSPQKNASIFRTVTAGQKKKLLWLDLKLRFWEKLFWGYISMCFRKSPQLPCSNVQTNRTGRSLQEGVRNLRTRGGKGHSMAVLRGTQTSPPGAGGWVGPPGCQGWETPECSAPQGSQTLGEKEHP